MTYDEAMDMALAILKEQRALLNAGDKGPEIHKLIAKRLQEAWDRGFRDGRFE